MKNLLQIGRGHMGVAPQVGGGAAGDQPAASDDADAIADVLGHFQAWVDMKIVTPRTPGV